jgi:magnesium chelatase subunit I
MDALSEKISAAQERLPSVEMPRDIKLKIATVCSELNIDGLRGDLVVNRASQALVAFEGRTKACCSARCVALVCRRPEGRCACSPAA